MLFITAALIIFSKIYRKSRVWEPARQPATLLKKRRSVRLFSREFCEIFLHLFFVEKDKYGISESTIKTLEQCPTSTMEHFMKIVNGLKSLSVSLQSSVLDVGPCSSFYCSFLGLHKIFSQIVK